MNLVIFGLAVSSSWGNGHATLWRGLLRSLGRLGHHATFFERDQPFYAQHRDSPELPGAELVLYPSWDEVLPRARRALATADAALVTSYCPDGRAASALVLDSGAAVRAFYDLDTPVTLERVRAGQPVPYLPEGGLGGFDLVLSYTGGAALTALRHELGARRVAPLYGSVDPALHAPAEGRPEFRADLSYLGTYSDDRQAALERLFLAPARRLPARRFALGGAQYPASFPWEPNVFFVRHLPPALHAAFYGSSPLTLNVTRAPMAALGFCPSARLFEAAACGVPVLSDRWPGIERFFEPERELLLAETTEHAVAAVELPAEALSRVGRRARERVLAEHTADHRARELLALLEAAVRAPPDGPDPRLETGG